MYIVKRSYNSVIIPKTRTRSWRIKHEIIVFITRFVIKVVFKHFFILFKTLPPLYGQTPILIKYTYIYNILLLCHVYNIHFIIIGF